MILFRKSSAQQLLLIFNLRTINLRRPSEEKAQVRSCGTLHRNWQKRTSEEFHEAPRFDCWLPSSESVSWWAQRSSSTCSSLSGMVACCCCLCFLLTGELFSFTRIVCGSRWTRNNWSFSSSHCVRAGTTTSRVVPLFVKYCYVVSWLLWRTSLCTAQHVHNRNTPNWITIKSHKTTSGQEPTEAVQWQWNWIGMMSRCN